MAHASRARRPSRWRWGERVLTWPDGTLWAIEIQRSLAPKLERGFHAACEDLSPARKFLVYPGTERRPFARDIEVIGLAELCTEVARVSEQT